jgi:hypothetical protein
MRLIMRFLLFLSLVTITEPVSSQTFGLLAGVTYSSILVKDNQHNYSAGNGVLTDDFGKLPGVSLGTSVEHPISKFFVVKSSPVFVLKGYKVIRNDALWQYSGRASLLSLDLPLYLKHSFKINKTKLFAMVGPYTGIGLIGKYKVEGTYASNEFNRNGGIAWGSPTNPATPTETTSLGSEGLNLAWNRPIKRLSYGLVLGFGFDIRDLQLGLSYSLGLTSISPYAIEGYSRTLNVLMFNIEMPLRNSK